MDYSETLKYLYNQLPMFQRIGGAAYKVGLDTSIALDKLYCHPHKSYKTIHVAGTNGKGSVSHLIATMLQLAGYKVGLYTSPHLVDFRERIRVNGKMISKEYVTSFINGFISKKYDGAPSFFELTMMMAFDYFRAEKVDYAVIEVGLGGRLDSTNIISPILSIITNISFDHTQFLGNTLPLIASEKAGIIKSGIPVVIGEATGDVKRVFKEKAESVNAPIIFAEESHQIANYERKDVLLVINTTDFGHICSELAGECQLKNANTVLNAVIELRKLNIPITNEIIANSFRNVCEISGLMGRWMKISDRPLTICDTGHNTGGMQYIVKQLAEAKYKTLRMIIGFVNDKDISHILDMMPKNASYYFTNAKIPRALSSAKLKEIAQSKDLCGNNFNSVEEAYLDAKINASSDDLIFIGGSTFIVADFLEYYQKTTGKQ